jgi:hypothetical protein
MASHSLGEEKGSVMVVVRHSKRWLEQNSSETFSPRIGCRCPLLSASLRPYKLDQAPRWRPPTLSHSNCPWIGKMGLRGEGGGFRQGFGQFGHQRCALRGFLQLPSNEPSKSDRSVSSALHRMPVGPGPLICQHTPSHHRRSTTRTSFISTFLLAS